MNFRRCRSETGGTGRGKSAIKTVLMVNSQKINETNEKETVLAFISVSFRALLTNPSIISISYSVFTMTTIASSASWLHPAIILRLKTC